MTATTSTPTRPATSTGQVERPDLRLRRAVQVALPALAGALLVFATATDPGHGHEGRAMVRDYAANIDQLQWHAASLHFAYGVWGLVPLALAPLVRGRGRRFMNAAAVLGALVMMSMPGLMLSDLFFAAIANESGLDTAMTMYDEMGAEQWAIKAYLVPGLVSMLLCLPVAFTGLARAGRTPWWGVAVAAAILPAFVVSGATIAGALVAGLGFAVLTALLARGNRATRT